MADDDKTTDPVLVLLGKIRGQLDDVVALIVQEREEQRHASE